MILLQTLFAYFLAEQKGLQLGRSEEWLKEVIRVERKHQGLFTHHYL